MSSDSVANIDAKAMRVEQCPRETRVCLVQKEWLNYIIHFDRGFIWIHQLR